MMRRPKPGGGRHPPPLAPTVSNFKPRAQWSTLESSTFLNVNLPGFYMDQIKITKDQSARTIKIEGQRPLSTQTKARFNEVYRVPDSCDMSQELNTSFSHGLLTIEFPVVVKSEKPGKVVGDDKGKTAQRPSHEGNRGTDGRSLRRSHLSDKERQVGTSQEKAAPKKEEPKTYKSVVEGKKEVPTASRVKTEQKVKEGEGGSSLGRKEQAKQEKVVEKKESSQMGQQKNVQKLKEEARGAATVGGSLTAKVPTQEEKEAERKTQQKVKEEGVTKTPTIGARSGQKVHAKAEKGDGEIGQKLKEERKINLGQKKQEEHTKQVLGDKIRRTEKEVNATNQAATELKNKESVGRVVERKEEGEMAQKLKEEEKIGLGQKKEEKHTKPADGDEANPELKTKERGERSGRDVNGNVTFKNDEKMVGDKVGKEEIQERVGEKKVEEASLVKETRDLKDNPEVLEPIKVDSGGPVKKETTIGGEDREKMVEKISRSETIPLLVQGQKETNNMNPPAAEGSVLLKQESHKYGVSLVNVGVASLVIMVFGAYVFVPLVKMFF